MSAVKVQPIGRPGAWERDGGLRAQAIRAFALAQDSTRRIQDDVAKLKRPLGRALEPGEVSWEGLVERNLFATAAVLLSAMAVEAFLNWYGVVRLGEEFYQSQCERLGLVQKLSVIIATCTGELLHEETKIVAVAKRLSEGRNRIAHLKTREAKAGRRASGREVRTPLVQARDAVQDMTDFFSLFIDIDPKAAGMAEHA